MDSLIQILLILHVAAGSTALVTAGIAVALKKGSPKHNAFGRVYFWAMMAVAVTAIPVSILRPNLMLFFVALFSSYMAYAGWRFGRKSRYLQNRAPYVEWLMLAVGLAMVGTGLIQVFSSTPMGWVLVAFGCIGIQFAVQDIAGWAKEEPFAKRISNHLTHMLGGTIATVTAVLVQQVVPRLGEGNPFAVAVWLAPTILITPFIAIWARHVQVTKRTRLLPVRKNKN